MRRWVPLLLLALPACSVRCSCGPSAPTLDPEREIARRIAPLGVETSPRGCPDQALAVRGHEVRCEAMLDGLNFPVTLVIGEPTASNALTLRFDGGTPMTLKRAIRDMDQGLTAKLGVEVEFECPDAAPYIVDGQPGAACHARGDGFDLSGHIRIVGDKTKFDTDRPTAQTAELTKLATDAARKQLGAGVTATCGATPIVEIASDAPVRCLIEGGPSGAHVRFEVDPKAMRALPVVVIP